MSHKIDDLLEAVLESYASLPHIRKIGETQFPKRERILEALRKLQYVIFPGFFDQKELRNDNIRFYTGQLLEEIRETLLEQVAKTLRLFKEECRRLPEDELQWRSAEIVDAFLGAIPKIREYLATDIEAAYEGDPAAFSRDEVISSYPGIYATMVNRIAHELYELGVPLIPRVMTEHAHSVTGIDIHPGAKLGKYFFIDHGTGIVIGETAEIGEHAKIYQGRHAGGAFDAWRPAAKRQEAASDRRGRCYHLFGGFHPRGRDLDWRRRGDWRQCVCDQIRSRADARECKDA